MILTLAFRASASRFKCSSNNRKAKSASYFENRQLGRYANTMQQSSNGRLNDLNKNLETSSAESQGSSSAEEERLPPHPPNDSSTDTQTHFNGFPMPGALISRDASATPGTGQSASAEADEQSRIREEAARLVKPRT